MKRKRIGFLLTIMLIALLAACGRGGEENRESEVSAAAGKTENTENVAKEESGLVFATVTQIGDGFIEYKPNGNLSDDFELVDGVTMSKIIKVMQHSSAAGTSYNGDMLRQVVEVILRDEQNLQNMTIDDFADALVRWIALGFYYDQDQVIVINSVQVNDNGSFNVSASIDGVSDTWFDDGNRFTVDSGAADITDSLMTDVILGEIRSYLSNLDGIIANYGL